MITTKKIPNVIILSLFTLSLLSMSLAAGDGMERLGENVKPTFQKLNLKMDPREADYSGTVEISLLIESETDLIKFHSENNAFDQLKLTRNSKEIDVVVNDTVVGLVKLTKDGNFEAGEYLLTIDFKSNFSTQAHSLYKLVADSNSYAFTQFEADDAREAFPCWDEPLFKFPYQLTISIPDFMDGVSNTPIESESIKDGWKTINFMKTPPIPSYLLAFACGEFEYTDIPGMSIPGRVVTVKGKSHLTGEAVKTTPPILKAMEEYFGQKYPYKKLDLLAVPEYWAGAMENPGAITYRETILLLDPDAVTFSQRRRIIAVTSHEIAHMWFGDLVTLGWWDDIWLNESFASWLGDRIVHQVYPEFKMDVSVVSSSDRAMQTDVHPTTEAIRQPVRPTDNLVDSFNSLSYSKGQAILTMFENWLGEDIFRKGVVDYIKAHEWGVATSQDFFSSISQASGENMDESMAPFLDQAGVPLVTLKYNGGNTVELTQERFSNYGITHSDSNQWTFPVQLKYSDGINIYTKTVVMGRDSKEIELPSENKLAWVYPNNGGTGYYRFSIPEEMLLSMAENAPRILVTHERVGFVRNLTALLDAGSLTGDTYMKIISNFGNDPDPQVISTVISGIGKIHSSFITPELEDSFAIFVRNSLHPALTRFGMEKTDGEDGLITTSRSSIFGLLAEEGKDEVVRKHLVSLAKKYNEDPLSIDPAIAGISLYVSAIDGDEELFDDYKNRFENAKNPSVRSRYLYSLGCFRNNEIITKALDYVFTGDLKPQEIFTIPFAISNDLKNEELVFNWVLENYDNFMAKMPPYYASRLARVAEGCSSERLEIAKIFFSKEGRNTPGMEKALAKIADRVNSCISLRDREGEAVANYLHSLSN